MTQVFLQTQRLVLRRFTVADADDLVSLDADPDVMRFVTGGVPTGPVDAASVSGRCGYSARGWQCINQPVA